LYHCTPVLRFVGKVDVVAKTGSVELAKFPSTHPFAGLQGADNIIEVGGELYGCHEINSVESS
jgi:homoserine dehydrogenase